MQLGPAVHRPRHRPRVGARGGNVPVGIGGNLVRGERGGSPAGAVQAVEAAGLRVPDDGEQVAADAARHRLHQSEGGVDRDGGVGGAASFLQHVHADLDRERVGGGHHPVTGEDDGPGGEGAPLGPVGAGRCGAHQRDEDDAGPSAHPSAPPFSTSWPAAIQALVPPTTLTRSAKPWRSSRLVAALER